MNDSQKFAEILTTLWESHSALIELDEALEHQGDTSGLRSDIQSMITSLDQMCHRGVEYGLCDLALKLGERHGFDA